MQQRIVRERRQYNQWVASQTLEDYALRYTAGGARKSSFRVGNTALGPIAFLACEAIGGGITLAYGFSSAGWAILAFTLLMFLIGLPIAYYAARYGVDIDLLTRGAGFGYLGSTLTSLIYASFTFLLFAIEASILSVALSTLFDIPLPVAHLLSSLGVIPIAVYGISLISRMQLVTQPLWLLLQFAPIAYIGMRQPQAVSAWMHYDGAGGASGAPRLLMFGMAASMLLSLLPQIGEQVDYLRFLPTRSRTHRFSWWVALLFTGPGWVIIGGLKLLVGSFLAVLALRYGLTPDQAVQPTHMYLVAFENTVFSPTLALLLTGLFVIVCQLKINVTNAYAGSIAWSNFFSRLTHSHPGRVVWLVFNVLLALLLMELGVLRAIDSILRIYANFAAGWIGALTADLVINKPFGLSPPYIEFRRAHLYDVNPVGVGALLLSVVCSSLAFLGVFGSAMQAFSPFLGLMVAFVAAPMIAGLTRGRFYLARPAEGLPPASEHRCTICENVFDHEDMALCPAYAGPICSLCCTLESRCRDQCKRGGRLAQQLAALVDRLVPRRLAPLLHTRGGHFIGVLFLCTLLIALLLTLVDHSYASAAPAVRAAVATTLWLIFSCLLVLSGIGGWLIVLAHESRRSAEAESAHQTAMLMEEIEAHRRTDAKLEQAKEAAESANEAKTRYVVSLSHEIRTPLNAIFGYAQLLERGSTGSVDNAVRVIRRSAEHLSNLIDGLLDISKIENGMLRLNRDTVQLDSLLEQLVEMFHLQAEAKGLEFRYERATHLPQYVHADKKRLRQILINLLSNAIKYTERGHVSLRVRYRSQVAEFEVTDTGPGVPTEDRERIFRPFERGTAAAVRAVPGTGLGLTITQLLTQIMGGEVLLQESSERGTTFVVRLMLPPTAAPEHISARRIVGYAGAARRLLITDDDATHVELVQDLLRPLGFELYVARDGNTSLTVAAQCHPELALIDLSLPDMTGWEVARRLRAACPSTRIVIVSANAHDYATERAASHDAFVMKPVDMQLLLEQIGALLQLTWQHAGSPAPAQDAQPLSEPAPPSRRHLDDLYQLGRIGHVRAIEAKLRELEAENPANEPFTSRLRALVATFDLKRYMSALEALRAHQ
jgi:signal transduction histidine kinase/CheY-like chemotaxis protein